MRPIDAVLNGLQVKPMYEGLPADDDPVATGKADRQASRAQQGRTQGSSCLTRYSLP